MLWTYEPVNGKLLFAPYRPFYLCFLEAMQAENQNKSLFFAAIAFLELVYHSIVREVRTQSGSATLGLLKEVSQILIFFLIFYALFTVMGRNVAIRGDFVLFLLSGIFLMLTHMGAISSVMGAGTAVSPIMQHAPMSVILSILASTFADLYLRIIAIIIVFAGATVINGPMEVANPAGLILPFFLAWSSGLAIGFGFMLLKPLAPSLVKAISKIYQRAQMVTSGKFMPAAYMPATLTHWFDWNPLFHCIDQARLAAFVNYNREVSNIYYPIYVTLVVLVLGLMGEFWARKNLSRSKHG